MVAECDQTVHAYCEITMLTLLAIAIGEMKKGLGKSGVRSQKVMQSSIRFKAADLGLRPAETGIKLWHLHI